MQLLGAQDLGWRTAEDQVEAIAEVCVRFDRTSPSLLDYSLFRLCSPSVGDRLIIHTPGGGAYGAPSASSAAPVSEPVQQFPRANGSVAAFMSMQETN